MTDKGTIVVTVDGETHTHSVTRKQAKFFNTLADMFLKLETEPGEYILSLARPSSEKCKSTRLSKLEPSGLSEAEGSGSHVETIVNRRASGSRRSLETKRHGDYPSLD